MVDSRQMHRRAGAMAAELIAGVGPEQFGNQTPCTEWNVRTLINHMTGGNLRFVGMLTGGSGPERAADVLGDSPLASFRDSFDALCEAFDLPGVLDGIYRTPLGERPGAVLVTMRTSEMTIHAWDIAAATGQPRDLDPKLVAYVDKMIRPRRAPRVTGSPFGAEQPAPATATAADRLAALTGRAVPPPHI
ncbi:TIGR03086 family metal-binding protein [Antrihabitans cavernicola]|uniref:TIGR03086 family protein n=1 Tax=Antrihabitans cavernicola TaxID=2495913 RepID=A0A5A7S9H3_9NOCA|nr:TIGR03086 family metal-binding protein [Spelaeibacter cavernicola]KAA0022556.1 TIGR03086 family protein [Spelaeibacter cavernicola]